MLIKEYRTYFIKQLIPLYGADEAESFFYLILEALRNMKRIDLALQHEAVFNSEEIKKWTFFLDALQEEQPIQYLLGKTSFYGLDFEVSKNVLIPRLETEELVEWIITDNAYREITILDIGTGSGCIAITLAKFLPKAKVYAIDVSEEALKIAKKNAMSNHAAVTFIQENILEAKDLSLCFDIIVSNPPYIRNMEKQEIRNNVLEHEPHLALFVPDQDPLIFYKKITALAKANFKTKGTLYFEINQYLAQEMVYLLSNNDFQNIELRKDIYNNDRMLKANYSN